MPLPNEDREKAAEIPRPIMGRAANAEQRSLYQDQDLDKKSYVDGDIDIFDLYRAHSYNNKLFYG